MRINLAQIMRPWSAGTPSIISVQKGANGGTGSANAPLGTLRAAILAALPLLAAGGAVSINLAAGVYSAETLPTIPMAAGATLTLNGPGVILPTVSIPSLVFSGAGSYGVMFKSISVASVTATPTGSLIASDSSIGDVVGNPDVAMVGCSLGAGPTDSVSVGSLTCRDTYVTSRVAATGNVDLTGGLITATGPIITTDNTIVRMFGTRIDPATISIVFSGSAGSLEVDSISNDYWDAATETLTNGSIALIGKFT